MSWATSLVLTRNRGKERRADGRGGEAVLTDNQFIDPKSVAGEQLVVATEAVDSTGRSKQVKQGQAGMRVRCKCCMHGLGDGVALFTLLYKEWRRGDWNAGCCWSASTTTNDVTPRRRGTGGMVQWCNWSGLGWVTMTAPTREEELDGKKQ